MSDPTFSQINRAVHEAKERREVGMQVGLGKVRLDISQVEHLLKHYASLQAENSALRERIKSCAVGPCPVLASLAWEEIEAQEQKG